MAMRCDSLKADAHGLVRGVVAMNAARSAKSGCMTHHSKHWNPPIELPINNFTRSTPRCAASRRWQFTMSRTVIFGKSPYHGSPVDGFMLKGPVVP